MKVSDDGLALIQAFEGCHRPVPSRPGFFKAYKDPIGVLTIGWGHTNNHAPAFTADDVWSQEKCDEVLRADLGTFERAVGKHVNVPLSQHQFDALVSFAYNCGEGNLKKSTLLKKVNARDFKAAAAEFAKWNKAGGKELPGLTRRRRAESRMFAGAVQEALLVAGAKRKPTKPVGNIVPFPPPPDVPPIEPADKPAKSGFFHALKRLFGAAS
jgi:lysozyme